MSGELVPSPGAELVQASEVPSLLDQIRPAWQAKDLINRVRRLLLVDPSSACQRLFNAAIHDLREKVVIAGLDIGKEAAKQHKLPPVERAEDVEEYPTAKLIDLAHRMGLLSRAEWRRLSRVYEIRKDLEHEDDVYEASVEDCIYVFKTCVEAVLSRDPIQLLRVQEVKDVVEQPGPAAPTQSLLTDYEHAPDARQNEIARFLISTALDNSKPDVVRQNSFSLLQSLEPLTRNAVKLQVATHLQEKLGRGRVDLLHARVAHAAGILAYLKQAQRTEFFESFDAQLNKVGPGWRAYPHHGDLLRTLKEVGGLRLVPPPVRAKILEWMVLAYMGEPGGYGTFGRQRPVFYSNTAAPLIKELVGEAAGVIRDELRAFESSPSVKRAALNEHIERRYQELLDIVETHAPSS